MNTADREITVFAPSDDQVMVMLPRDEAKRLVNLAWHCSEELEVELNDRYSSRDEQPVQMRRYQRDMGIVLELRNVIERLSEMQGQ